MVIGRVLYAKEVRLVAGRSGRDMNGYELGRVDEVLLSVILEAGAPVGARAASRLLRERGPKVSEATVSRSFARLDQLGLTAPVGVKGRILTDSGRRHIEQRLEQDQRAAQFDRALQLKTVQEISDWVTARQLLESQAARLAAERATVEHLDALEQSLADLERRLAEGGDPTPVGLGFHQILAEASGSHVFAALIGSLYSASLVRVERALDVILQARGVMADSAEDHRHVFDALSRRDPAAASEAMSQHLGRLLREVERFEDDAAFSGGFLYETLRLIEAARFPS